MAKGKQAVVKSEEQLFSEGYDRACQLLYACSLPEGFLASPTEDANYRRIWARDGVIIGLAGLLTQDHDLVTTLKHTLETLANYQGPHGEIPSNVDPASERISYGGTTGRVDASLWFIIGCAEYWQATGDDAFLERILPAIEKVRFLLGAWEFNNRGLLYVPLTGDWADEYLQNGYVLYDQLLYLQAQRALCVLHAHRYESVDHALLERVSRLRHVIRANYWFDEGEEVSDDIYHEVLHEKGRAAASHYAGRYWAPFFSPTGYGYRFDAFANVLTSLLEVADENQRECVDQFIEQEILQEALPLLPAFHPVIEPVDEDWKHLQMTFSYTFKNKPYEFQNGGLWPMITGFYVADLARRGNKEAAARLLKAVHEANALEMEGEPWSFPEFVHGKKLTAGGTRHQGWSAAGAIVGHHALQGDKVLKIDTNAL
jgi:GH15 family glucan-1,4-alpha-glucosidase